MRRENVRVILASKHPHIRSLLKDMVKSEGRVNVIGQAENAVSALALARDLRPDVAIIDNYLPHAREHHTLPFTRMGGLHAAQTIFGEMPDVRVVLLNRSEDAVPSVDPTANAKTFFCRETGEACIPFTISKLGNKSLSPGALIIARIEAITRAALRHRTISDLSDKAIFFGALGILGGWFLTIALWLVPPSAYISLAGFGVLFIGLAGKLISKIFK